MKRVYCLYRVSTAQQVDVVKDDIPMQRIACHDFAARMGWTILVEKEEKGISGFKVSAEKRDAIQELKEAALNKAICLRRMFMIYYPYINRHVWGEKQWTQTNIRHWP